MTLARVNDEERTTAVKPRKRIVVANREDSFEASVLRYAATRNLSHVPSLMKAASGTRLSPRTVIRRCATLSARAFVRAQANEPTK